VPSLSLSKRTAGPVLVAASAGAATPNRAARAIVNTLRLESIVNTLRLESITIILVMGVFRTGPLANSRVEVTPLELVNQVN
jgi:hypothetical protein